MEVFFLYNYYTFFYSISVISLPEALTLAFISPIVVTVLSIFILRERVGIHRWIAVFTGFLGVLIILRPGFNEINFASISALLAGIIYALFLFTLENCHLLIVHW